MDTQRALYLLGTVVVVSAWLLGIYLTYRNLSKTPTKFYRRYTTYYIDRRVEPGRYWIRVIPIIVIYIFAGYFCGLVIYFKLPQILGTT